MKSVFISGYDNINLQISKDNSVLGWKKASIKYEMKIGDYVFIYNRDSRQIESVFEIESPYNDIDKPIWKEESKNSIIFKNRWSAKILFDGLNIHLNQIADLFFNGKAQDFGLYVKNDFPKYVDDKHKGFLDFLIDKFNIASNNNTNHYVKNNDVSYFLIQVGQKGSMSLIENKQYSHIDWQNTPRDSDHGKAKKGDVLLVYVARNSIKYGMSLKKIYEINEVSDDTIVSTLSTNNLFLSSFPNLL
jgi:hypothetical protein